MIRDLYDKFSYVFSWRWPVADGEITAVGVRYDELTKTNRLAVTFRFVVGTDGPYTGELLSPLSVPRTDIVDITQQFRIGSSVRVRYRVDDPSVNRLDRMVWQNLDGL